MSISGVSSYDQLSAMFALKDINSSQGTTSTTTGTGSVGSTSDQASFSPMAQMMSQLYQMQTSDPSQFQQVTSQISQDLSAQAGSTTDSQQSQALSDLSSKFAQASQTGSMASLSGGHGGHKTGGAGGAGGADGTFSVAASTISADLSNAGITSNASFINMLSNASISMAPGQGTDEMGNLMKELKQLQTSDPAKFKEVTAKISSDLAAQAKDSTDPGQARMLSDMSEKFSEASTSGSMASLRPQGPPPSSADGSAGATLTVAGSTGQQNLQSYIQSMINNDVSSFTTSAASAMANA